MLFDKKFLIVLQCGVATFFVFTAYQTCRAVQPFVISSVKQDRNESWPPIDENAGYISTAINYGSKTLFNIFAPSITNKVGSKWSIVIGATSILLFLTSFFYITNIFLYATSAILGFGTAGDCTNVSKSYLYLNCINSVVALHVVDRMLSYQQLTRCLQLLTLVKFTFLLVASTYLVVAMQYFALAKEFSYQIIRTKEQQAEILEYFWRCMKAVKMFELLKTTPMILFSILFAFSGLAQGYFFSVYGTSLANTLAFPLHKELLALNTLFGGIGETFGCLLFGLVAKNLNRIGRDLVVVLGSISNMIAYSLIFINIPSQATIVETISVAYIEPNQYLALFCSFLLGLADACYNTQIFSVLTIYYAKDCGPAFGIYEGIQSLTIGIGCFYSGVGDLYTEWQLLILAVTCPLATVCFAFGQRIFCTSKLSKEEEYVFRT